MDEISILKDISDFSKMKVPDLKKELKSRGLSAVGNKTELVERLQKASKSKDDNGSEKSVDDQVEDLDDDLLNDDDSDHDQDNIVANESVLKELEEQLDVSPSIKGVKRPFEDPISDSKPLKKIVLNRKPSVTGESSNTKEKSPEVITPPIILNKVEAPKDVETDSKKVIKLTSLSGKERLEMRAKKFGTPPSADAKKVARLERFGGSTSNTLPPATGVSTSPNLDTLKKRAERFGGSVSKAMSSLEQQERLELRKARFGNLPTNGVTVNDKAKQRLERFKTPVN